MPIGIDIVNSITYDVSIVSVSMNRHTALISSLHNWLFFPVKEIVIIDWCSYTLLDDIIPTYLKELVEYKKVKIYRVDGFDKWVLTWAYNLGLDLATSEYILKLDSEVIITNPSFFEINKINPNILVRGSWSESHTEYLNGSFYCKKENLVKIGYYNERIVTYGWDDCDLYKRLVELGLEEKLISFIDHIEHSDNMRTVYNNRDICLKTEVNKNRILSISYPTLRYDKNRYQRINDKDFKIIKTRMNLNNTVSNKITLLNKGLFSEDKFVVLKVVHGIANRLRALLSTIDFTEFFGYKLYVIWEISNGFDNSQFEEYFRLRNSAKITFISSDNLESIDNFDLKIYSKITDKPTQIIYETNYKKIYLELYNYIYGIFDFKDKFKFNLHYFKNLLPSRNIKNIVNYIEDNIIIGKYNVFHIRRGDAINGPYKHYYCISSIYLFAKYINMSDKINVVLSDDYEYCQQFLDILCKNKYIIINKTNLNKNKTMYETKYGINMDVVDFALFENACNIYGSHWSSFSWVAGHVFDKFANYTVIKDTNVFCLNKCYDYERFLPFVNTFIDTEEKPFVANLDPSGNIITDTKLYLEESLNPIQAIYDKYYC
jgi:hypothetical protein